METVEQLYNRNPSAKFMLPNSKKRLFIHLWKTAGKATYSAVCRKGNRIKLNPNDLVIETIN